MGGTPPPALFLDYVCPFSCVMDAAVRRWSAANDSRVDRRAYELFPAPIGMEPPPDTSALPDALHAMAAEEGLELRSPSRRSRTRKAHEAALFACEKGRGAVMRAALFRAYFEADRDLARIDVLLSCGAECGLDETELKVALDIDRYTDRVVAESAAGRRMGVEGVPSLIVPRHDGAELVAGALPYHELDRILTGH